jgi:hypothetical protein
MLEHNKNLSSIVGTIQDEVSPTGASRAASAIIQDVNDTVGSDPAQPSGSISAGRQRSAWRSFLFLMFAALTLAAAFVFVADGRTGYLAELPYELSQYITRLHTQAEDAVSSMVERTGLAGEVESVVPAIAGGQVGNFGNQEIHERQAMIMKQLQELTAAIVVIKADNDQYQVDNQGEMKRMQDLFQHKIDKVAATVAGLQAGSAARKESLIQLVKSSGDVNAIQSDAGEVPAMGGWVVNVANSGHIDSVAKLKNKLHKLGIPAETQEVTISGKLRYRLRIPGFASRDEARDYAANLDGDLGLKGPWVSKR